MIDALKIMIFILVLVAIAPFALQLVGFVAVVAFGIVATIFKALAAVFLVGVAILVVVAMVVSFFK